MPAIAVLCAFLVAIFENLIGLQATVFLTAFAVPVGLAIRWKNHRVVLLCLATTVAAVYVHNF
ncbi:hypothetical protein AB0L99_42790 [Streptomyces sp. NPDC051954]|uniref:hypothetical protein n=1 Tax=unclassified Streptomyces TaxID=2593676 RepID=UPI003423067C